MIFFHPVWYALGLLFALFWGSIFFFLRYCFAQHSLDQVLLGMLLGIWEGCILHFFVREKLIVHIGNINRVHRGYIQTQNRFLSILSKDVLDRQTLLNDQNEYSVNSNQSVKK